jgi:hypothetical protein
MAILERFQAFFDLEETINDYIDELALAAMARLLLSHHDVLDMVEALNLWFLCAFPSLQNCDPGYSNSSWALIALEIDRRNPAIFNEYNLRGWFGAFATMRETESPCQEWKKLYAICRNLLQDVEVGEFVRQAARESPQQIARCLLEA